MLEVRHHGLVFPRMWPLNQLLCFQSALGGTSSPWSCPPGPPPAPRVPVGSGASMPGFADTLTRLDDANVHRGRVAARRADAARLCPHRGRLPSLARGLDLGHHRPLGISATSPPTQAPPPPPPRAAPLRASRGCWRLNTARRPSGRRLHAWVHYLQNLANREVIATLSEAFTRRGGSTLKEEA